MTKFLIYTDESYDRQDKFILCFYPGAIKNQIDDGIIIWKNNYVTVGESKILTPKIFLLTLIADFLTNINDTVVSLNFSITSLPFVVPSKPFITK